ncbi:L-threonylcarbamoyladenylate synthase [uncultured Tistrella sp.]|uniref:L-threonylcarbamoyladenylate synthase n=1 Tax=Tistrella mobilis TaxID=171437 RepID=UPI000C09C121|nr:L-threonylcarbamoyladenylate synthase [uncultured Tistrella sp.]MAM73490.1 hypothetical protein [Tistrella sp.]|tara:strand:+ start:159 stop:881 length:723 start_codon:yes stop_codon:yes gene_type:complete
MVNIVKLSAGAIDEAAEVIRAGGLVITPTRTQYNLICDAFNADAIQRVFDVKKRTKFGPLTFSIANPAEAARHVVVPEWVAPDAFERLWPGELTLIFDKACDLPPAFTMGYDTLGVACQGVSPLEDIIRAAGRPVGATSANISGQGDIFVDLDKAVADIGDGVDLIIDLGGDTPGATSDSAVKANTIVDFTFERPYLVRAGVYPVSRIQEVFPNLDTDTEAYKQRLMQRVNEVRGRAASA